MTAQKTRLRHIPNILSLYRILAAPVLISMVFLEEPWIFAWLLLVSLVSDILDGVVARRFHFQSDLGARLDSIGDMATYIVAVIGIIFFHMDFIQDHMMAVGLVLGFYFFQIAIALAKYRKITSFHTTLAKINAYAQGIFIMTLFLFGFQGWVFYPMVVLSILSYSEEIIMVLLLPEPRSNISGLPRVIEERRAA